MCGCVGVRERGERRVKKGETEVDGCLKGKGQVRWEYEGKIKEVRCLEKKWQIRKVNEKEIKSDWHRRIEVKSDRKKYREKGVQERRNGRLDWTKKK